LFYNGHSGTFRKFQDIGHGGRRTYNAYSDDAGSTWSTTRDLTEELIPKDFTWDAVGPGNGIEKKVEPDVGQLIVPATGRNFFSNDHGTTWRLRMVPWRGPIKTGEGAVVERKSGELCRYDRAERHHWPHAKRRWVSCGALDKFPSPTPQENLPDPKMQASILGYGEERGDTVVFLNSDSTHTRHHMKVRDSFDGGKTWVCSRYLYVGTPPDNHRSLAAADHAGKGGYSSMAPTGDYHLAALVEVSEPLGKGKHHYGGHHMSIDFHKFNLRWIHEWCDRDLG
jgi:sialidase-1